MNCCVRGFVLALTVFVMTLCFIPDAGAQATTGSIVGRVTDPSKAVVVEAQVTALNQATGVSYTGKSNESGEFVVQRVPPGVYTVTVTQPGFETAVAKDLELVIDQKLAIEFDLKVGKISTVETVTAVAPLLQTESVETGAVIGSQQILDLPLLGRNFLQLSLLAPGVINGEGGNTLNLSVNGQREFANSVLIDGVEATANRNNDTNLTPSVDAVEEFKVATSDYSAEFGRAAGGVISIQTKSGTNRYHGSAYEFYRPSATAAENYAFPTETPSESQLSQHNFGATFGGPIIKNKTFFFISYEQTRNRNAFNYIDSVPPINQINFLPNGGVDLTNLKDPGDGNTMIPLFDPAISYANYGGYAQQYSPPFIIPASEVSPAGVAILKNFFPVPNIAITPGPNNGYGWYDNFQVNAPYQYNGKNGDAKVDLPEISSKDHVSVAYHYSDFNSLQGDPFWGAIPVQGGGDADQGDREDARSQEISATETHIFSSRSLNEFRFGYSRYHLDDFSLLNGENLADQYGVGNVNLPGIPATSGFPYIYLGSGYVTGGSTYKPLFFSDSNFQFSDNVTLTRSNHEFRLGADYRRLNSHPIFSLYPTGFQYYSGAYSYSQQTGDPTFNGYTYVPYDPNPLSAFPYGGSDIADLLTGLPQSVQIGLQLTTPHTQSWELHFYGEDVWKATPRLTLIYGVRYEYQNPFTEANGDLSGYDLANNTILIAGRGGNSDALINSRKNDFSPRVGLAYKITPRTVIRAGYGLFYTPENDAREDVLTKNYPFAVQQYFYNGFYNGSPSYTLDTGVSRITSIPVGSNVSSIDPSTIPDGSVQSIYYVDPNLKTGNSQLFNITLQREVTPSLSVEAAYVGSLAHDLPYAIGDINQASRITADLGTIEAQESLGWSKFNSFQVKATKRLSANLNFLAAYTYGHSIDNGPAPFNLGKNHNQPQDPFDLGAELASSDNDVRHNLVFSSVYHLPLGHGQQFFGNWQGARQLILGGWQINGIFNARTGTPVNVVRDGNGVEGVKDTEGLRPNLVGNPVLSGDQRTLSHYFNTAAFSEAGFDCTPNTNPLCFVPGTAGRNLVRGPGYVNADFSFFKDFGFREAMKLQLRFEFFNLTNTPHFSSPGGDESQAGTFGKITQTFGNPRVIQFAAKFIF
jgi:outer membrane receptor protein involved in Fe transport